MGPLRPVNEGMNEPGKRAGWHRWMVLLIFVTLFAHTLPSQAVPAWQSKVAPSVLALALDGEAEFIVFLAQQADVSQAAMLPAKPQKGQYVFNTLSRQAQQTQRPLLSILANHGAAYRSYWVANMIWVRGDMSTLQTVAQRAEVAQVFANPAFRLREPLPEPEQAAAAQVAWNLALINAPQVWAEGITGQNIVIGGQDTGYDWDHPALINQYRGWDGENADHNYNWHDAIHNGGGICGVDAVEPCDDWGHGTHTMGIMVGDDGDQNQIGVAPGARWMGCRNMNAGVGTPASYSECFQWFIAPTNLQGENPDPALAPHVINNSWSCPPSEGCLDPLIMRTIVSNTRAAGIVVVASAGNSGSSCSTINTPPAIYDESFTVGATTSSDVIATYSSRGPVTIDGSNRPKPDVVAPGSDIRSSWHGGGYTNLSGTSMAAPHVAGTAALMMAANPNLIGQVAAIEDILARTAQPRTTEQTCGDVPGSLLPNNTYGYGRIDALAAVSAAQARLGPYQLYTAIWVNENH